MSQNKIYNNSDQKSIVNFADIEAVAQNDVPGLVQKWLPDGKQQGDEWVALNPTRADHTVGSFKINLNTGVWADFATKDSGNNVASLYHYISGNVEYRDSMLALGTELGVGIATQPKPNKQKKPPIVYKKPPSPNKIGKLTRTATWKYQDAEGQDVLLVHRFDSDDKKQFRQVSRVEGGWSWGGLNQNPLYRLLDVSCSELPIVFCEGEKATDAAQQIFKSNAVTTTTAGGAGGAKKTDFSPVKNRAVYIWPDNDQPGKKYADQVAKLALKAGASSVRIFQPPKHWSEKWDAADVLAQGGEIHPPIFDFSLWSQVIHMKSPQLVTPILAESKTNTGSNKDWESKLTRNAFGYVVKTKLNVRIILTDHPEWKGVIGHNNFNHQINKISSPPYPNSPNNGIGEWTDADNILLSMWIAENYGIEMAINSLQEIIVAVALNNTFNPVQDYLESCHEKWIKAGRPNGHATRWVEKHLGAKESPANRIFQKAWTISAVARAYEPGCKVDNVLILEGDQGLLKSTALSVLGGAWFSDTTIDFNDKDSLMLIHENWIIEMPELDKFKKADSDKAKSFFARQEDKYRAPYGHNLITMKRQCVFAGTTNTEDYLKDSTGNRRYMPIKCHSKCDLKALQADRDLIWGEAVDMYKQGEEWWYDDKLQYVQDAQNDRFAEDVWQDEIEEYLDLHPKGITIQIILTDALKMDLDRCGKLERNRVADILRKLQWKQSTRVMIEGKWKRGWKPIKE